MVDGAAGHVENGEERMVKTPWFDHEIPFAQAAEIGTDKVMRDHSTIGLVITTDGSIGELPRSNYLGAEEKTILALKKSGKPFLVLVNSQKPYSEETRQVAEEIGSKYDVSVMPVNCEQLKKEDKIKKAAIKELVKNPTEEIKNAVIEQLPEEQKETIVEQEIEIVKEELKKDPQFIQICKNKAMSELENIEELEIKIENLSTEKDYLEESMAELEIQHKKQRKELAEEYEREKRRNIERIRQMQNTTYEEQQKNPSFWDSLKERISKSKFISSLIIFKMELDKKIPIPQILSDLKYFSKRYDFYMEKPERALEQQEIFEHGYGITIYEHEQDTYGKNQEKEIEDDYNEIEP